MKVHLTMLGCAKNQVDSEILLGRLAAAGHTICLQPEAAEVIIVNTCAFIEAAINEAIDTILELAFLKAEGNCRQLIVCGCLPQRFGENLAETMPEVDLFFGTGALDQLPAALDAAPGAFARCVLPSPDRSVEQQPDDSRVCDPAYSVYIKIAEGCDRHCTYCIIPKLRGRQRSRPLGDIVTEARHLIESGARELILVAQETTAYGRDLSPSPGLPELLRSLSDLSPQTWIRLLYAHPASLDDATIAVMAERDNICSYFDVPIQHAADRLLRRMGRGHTAAEAAALFDRIRTSDPGAVLRTTAMVGFPGETEFDFEELLGFVKQIQFDHLGGFIYSEAEDIRAYHLDGRVNPATAQNRYDRLMTAQADISGARNQARIGRVVEVLLEEKIEPGLFEGRAWFQAPEVDGITCVSCPRDSSPGDIVAARLTDATTYDLTGEML
ncbi:MAG: 30S ribosomal protein S12 methylthiotransferase RimO [Desulfosudaceae bacterium]